MVSDIRDGQVIGEGFKVIDIRNRTVGSPMSNPIIDFVEIKMDCKYENAAFLHMATFQNAPPPSDEWSSVALTGSEQICSTWNTNRLKDEYVAIAYKKKEQGRLIAVTHIMTTKSNTLVSAQLLWFGFPLINSFDVGFKPGMRERTEDLLLASLPLI